MPNKTSFIFPRNFDPSCCDICSQGTTGDIQVNTFVFKERTSLQETFGSEKIMTIHVCIFQIKKET